MSILLRRRAMLLVKSQSAGLIYFGDTPTMNSQLNQGSAKLVELNQPSSAIYNYILIISKDRRAYKQFAYTQDTLTQSVYGKISFNAEPHSGSVSSDSNPSSFILRSRESNASIIVGHTRMTSNTGNFYYYYPQAFEVYGLIEPYEEGSIN